MFVGVLHHQNIFDTISTDRRYTINGLMASIESALQQKLQKLYGLIEASTLVISTLEIDRVLQLVMEIAKRVVEAQASSLLILNEATGLLEYEVALGEKGEEVKKRFSLELGQGIAGWVAQHGKPLLVPDVEKDERFFKGSDQVTGFVTRSILCVPMFVHGKMIGVLEVINPLHGSSFQEGDLELMSAFSSLAAIAIENAKLTQKKLEQQALDEQLSIARQIQDNFLKKEFPNLKHFEGYAKTRSAHEIGGDFYDFMALGDNRWGLLIGDVSGRGVPAALYMVKTLSEFRLEAFSSGEVSEKIARLNDRLVKKSTFGMFVTLMYLVLDLKTGMAEIVNAGHLPFYVYGGKGRALKRIGGVGGLPLGILPRAKFPVQKFQFEKGEGFLLLTDGLIEARNSEGEEFGWESVTQYLESVSSTESPREVGEGLLQALDRFRGYFAFPDDVTLVTARVKE